MPRPVVPPDAAADLLDRDHQGIAEQHRPTDVEPQLCASLRVGGDAARVVVRRAGDKAGAEQAEPARLARCPWLLSSSPAAPLSSSA